MAGLAATLLASAGLALWPTDAPDDLLPPARPAAGGRAAAGLSLPAAAAPATASARIATLVTRPADWPALSADAQAAWQGAVPAPAPVAPTAGVRQPPAASRAPGPAFPYRWIGQLDDGGAPQLLLASAQRTVAVRLGAELDGRWRLLRGPGGVLQAQPLPEGDPLPVPGAPPAPLP